MIGLVLKKIFGSKNEREIKRMQPIVVKINELERELQSKPDEVLREKTAFWKEKLSQIKDNAELKRELEAILPEAFAVVKNACRRLCGQKRQVVQHLAQARAAKDEDRHLLGQNGLAAGDQHPRAGSFAEILN